MAPVIMSKIFVLPSSGSGGGGSGTLASDIAVGESVFLNVNGVLTEFLIVHQGLPSSLYDSSCDGTWLLMKDIYETRQWHSSTSNSYKASTIHTYLNGDFLGLFSASAQNAIKQVKIPYVNGTGSSAIASGSNGLSTKIFLLSGYEIGFTTSTNQYFPIDGACLSYFIGADNAKRAARLDGAATRWWLRSPYTSNTTNAWHVLVGGDYGGISCSASHGVRPALILPSNALFDSTTKEFVGVGGNSGSGSTSQNYTVNITGSIHGLHSYVTINETKYESSGTYTFDEKPTISVYVTGTSTTARNDCSITLNNKLVQNGYGTYTIDFGSAKIININFASGAGSLDGTYYSASITTT